MNRAPAIREAPCPCWLWLAAAWALAWLSLFPLATLKEVPGDEGLELAKAVLWARGSGWPESWWNDQPLTHTRWYAMLLAWFPGASGPRGWSVLSSAVLLGSVGHIARVLGGSGTTAALAVAWCAASPQVAELSVAAMQEIPAAAWGLLSVALVTSTSGRPSGWRFGLAVLAGAGATCIKLTAGLYAGAAFTTLWVTPTMPGAAREGSRRLAWRYALLYLVSFCFLFRMVEPRPFADLLAPHLAVLPEAIQAPPAHGHTPVSLVLRYAPGFAAAAAVGLVGMLVGVRGTRRWDARWLVLPAWAGAFNAVIHPWWTYYSLSLWVALAPLAARGCEVLCGAVVRGFGGGLTGARWWAVAGLAAGVLADAGRMAHSAWAGMRHLAYGLRTEASPVQRAIRASVPPGPGATLFTTHPSEAFWSGLKVPGELLVVTTKRFLAGDLDAPTVVSRVRAGGPDVLVLGLGESAARHGLWPPLLADDYVLTEIAEGREVYVHRRHQPRPYEARLRW